MQAHRGYYSIDVRIYDSPDFDSPDLDMEPQKLCSVMVNAVEPCVTDVQFCASSSLMMPLGVETDIKLCFSLFSFINNYNTYELFIDRLR